MRTVTCPNCGAPVKFRAGASVFAVCEFCQTTLLASDEQIRNLGKMAELLPDPTRIQLGTEGRHAGSHFAVVGRIQMQYARGVWNEWHLLYDSGKSGWLSDVAGECFMTFEQRVVHGQTLPAFDALTAGQSLRIRGEPFTVTDIQKARCIAGAGELPFAIGAGYDAPVIDLRSEKHFATLDYSDGATPRIFMGERVDRAALSLANLREADDTAIPSAVGCSLACPGCGVSLSVSSEAIRTLACRSCGAVLDPGDPKATLIREAAGKATIQPAIAVGSTGSFGKDRFEVIGFMLRRALPAAGLPWSEYLLWNRERGFRWLLESSGHWTLTDAPLATVPTPGRPTIEVGGDTYKHFATYSARVERVLGEFTWQVRAGDECMIVDYIAPPHIVSLERTATEISASRGQYMTPAEVARAFGLKKPLPEPSGVAPHQISPYRQRAWTIAGMAIVFTMLLGALQLWFGAGAGTAARVVMNFAPNLAESSSVSEAFRLPDSRHLTLRTSGDLENAWAGFDVSLVDRKSGRVWTAEQGIEQWTGVDDGERWTEDNRASEIVFRNVPAGEYHLAVALEQQGPGRKLSRASFQLTPQKAGVGNWFLAQLLLLTCPAWAALRQWNFEVQRWADSDHPLGSSGADDDSDDD